jgi:branched-chain amino acid transport system ATP-binding protein
MLAMARALIQRPKVLLVDELSMGLAPVIVERLFAAIRQVATDSGCAVVFVEQYVHVALQVADAASILNRGRLVLSGPATDLATQREQLEHAYFGTDTESAIP